jgi:hypothetical protein
MRYLILFVAVVFLHSCSDDVTGVLVENNKYKNIVIEIIDAYENNDLSILEKHLSNDVTIQSSTNRFKSKESVLDSWNDDYYYYSDFDSDIKKKYTIYNSDGSYSFFIIYDWIATGNFSKKRISIPSFSEYIFVNEKISSIKLFFNNRLYHNEVLASYNKLL